MPSITLCIPHCCPYCNADNFFLKYFVLTEDVPIKAPGDIIYSIDTGFIYAEGRCENCGEAYKARVGILKSELTNKVKTFKIGDE